MAEPRYVLTENPSFQSGRNGDPQTTAVLPLRARAAATRAGRIAFAGEKRSGNQPHFTVGPSYADRARAHRWGRGRPGRRRPARRADGIAPERRVARDVARRAARDPRVASRASQAPRRRGAGDVCQFLNSPARVAECLQVECRGPRTSRLSEFLCAAGRSDLCSCARRRGGDGRAAGDCPERGCWGWPMRSGTCVCAVPKSSPTWRRWDAVARRGGFLPRRARTRPHRPRGQRDREP